jgi:hypothetical protein
MSFEFDQAQQPFFFSWDLGNEFAMIHFIMNVAQGLLLLFNGFCFSTKKK